MDLLGRWFKQVSFVGAVRGEQLRQAALSLRRQCKADRTAYLDTLADEVQANKVDGAAALQSLLQQRHKKPFTPAVLPSLRKVDGTLCGSSEEIQRCWREHFGDMEAGVACEPACLVGSAPQEAWPLPGQLLDMPSPSEILSALAATQAGKAPGPDGIPGEALSSAPAAFLMPLLPLVLKLCLRGEEAVGLQGATLCPLYKQRGARDECSSYRAIMLLSTIAKAMHKALRPKLYAHVDCKAPATLLGGRKGASQLSLAVTLSRAFVDGNLLRSVPLPLFLQM